LQTLFILTDIAFNIYNLRNYSLDPHNFIHYQHKDLIHLADNIIHTRDELGYTTHIGKVKSYTGVTHSYEAGAGARSVAEGTKTPYIIFKAADPPIGGLRIWSQTRTHNQDKTSIIKK